ncbi:hypothetical protein CQZ88_26985 [Rhodococcus sp. ENV425]|nr:hypothetical protein CQZ88_26985 [Rhodococcus sp. ENV425]
MIVVMTSLAPFAWYPVVVLPPVAVGNDVLGEERPDDIAELLVFVAVDGALHGSPGVRAGRQPDLPPVGRRGRVEHLRGA